MAKARDIVAEIAAKTAHPCHGTRPWWERAPAEHHDMLAAIHAAWHRGEFGTKKITAARTISAALREFGFTVGEQGVVTWLKLPPRS
jgi:hypothetical protein